jgi:hypothetical protein
LFALNVEKKVKQPESLFMLERAFGQRSAPSQAYPDYLDLRERSRSFESLVSYDIMGSVGLDTGSGNPSVVWPGRDWWAIRWASPRVPLWLG